MNNLKILFAPWASSRKNDYAYQNWFVPLKEIFRELILFDPKKEYFEKGKDYMNKKFINLVKREKPDYIFMSLIYDEFC